MVRKRTKKFECNCEELFKEKMKKLGMWDFGLIKLGIFFFSLAVAIIWPILVSEKYLPIWIALFVLAMVKPIYTMYCKK